MDRKTANFPTKKIVRTKNRRQLGKTAIGNTVQCQQRQLTLYLTVTVFGMGFRFLGHNSIILLFESLFYTLYIP